MGQVPNSGQTTQVGVGDAAILSPPPAPVASPDDLENIEKRLLSEWPGSSSDSEKPSLIEDQTANDLGMVEIPLESMRGDEAEPNVEADSSDAIKTETPEPTEAQPTDDATKAVDETQAEPATITLEESERRQAQAVNTARENLIRQQAAERQRLEVQAKVDAEANAEANRIANMSDSELAQHYRNKQAVDELKANMMLKHQAEIKKLKSDYEGADAESSDAENRNGEAEPSLVGDIGRSGSRSITQIEEAMITGGMASLTPNERQTINAFYQRQGIAPR
jgi:hypothetical protein